MKTFSQKLFLFLIYSLLYLPILVLVVYSVNDAKFSLQWHGFSMRWYNELFQDRGLWASFAHSVLLGLSASTIATTIGLLTCVNLFLFRSRHQRSLKCLAAAFNHYPRSGVRCGSPYIFQRQQYPFGVF